MVGEEQTVGAGAADYVVGDGASARGAIVYLVCTFYVSWDLGLGSWCLVGVVWLRYKVVDVARNLNFAGDKKDKHTNNKHPQRREIDLGGQSTRQSPPQWQPRSECSDRRMLHGCDSLSVVSERGPCGCGAVVSERRSGGVSE